MPAYRLRYLFGPCNGRTPTVFFPGVPPQHVKCGGQTYNKEPSVNPNEIAYVLASADQLIQPGEIVGERDLFRAWSALHRAWNQTTREELTRIRRASHRIRRAVR